MLLRWSLLLFLTVTAGGVFAFGQTLASLSLLVRAVLAGMVLLAILGLLASTNRTLGK